MDFGRLLRATGRFFKRLRGARRGPQARARRRCRYKVGSPARPSSASGCHQPSPTGSARALDLQIEREMGEDMANRAERIERRGRGIGPLAPRKRGHCAEQALCRPTDKPDMAIALDPPRDSIAVRANPAFAPLGKAFGLAAQAGRAVGAKRALAAARLPWPANRGAEVHQRLNDVAGRVPAIRSKTRRSISAREGRAKP